MPYGTVKVDNITFDQGGADQNVTTSGIYRAITSGVTVTGTISGAVLVGTTTVSGATVTGTTVQGTTVQGVSGAFTSLTGTTTTGTTANFVSGVFTTRVSGATITGTTAQFTSGTFVSLTGTSITGTTISGTTVSSTTGTFTSLTGTTITGTTVNGTTVNSITGNFTSLTGVTVTGTTARFVSGVFTTQVSGLTVTGTQSSFTSGNFVTLSGATATFTSGVIASGTAAAPSLSILGDPNTGIYSPGADQVAISTNGSGRFFIDSTGRATLNSASAINISRSDNDLGNISAGWTTAGTFDSFTHNATISFNDTFLPSFGPSYVLAKSNSDSIGTHVAVINGTILGSLQFQGSNGTIFTRAADIQGFCAGTVSSTAMPGELRFRTTPAGANGPLERMRITSTGNIAIGTSTSGSVSFRVASDITAANISYQAFWNGVVQPDVTNTAYYHRTSTRCSSTSFTLGSLVHYAAGVGTQGGATITSHYGFLVEATVVGATNNWGFFGNIPAGTGNWNFWANGTAPNYFAGDVRSNTVFTARTAPANSNVTATATAASLLDGLRTGTPAANINLTLPTGANMDAAFQELQNNQSFEWSLINLAAATHVITVVANTTHTVVGNMGVAAASSGRFLTRKTTDNTFITYRLA